MPPSFFAGLYNRLGDNGLHRVQRTRSRGTVSGVQRGADSGNRMSVPHALPDAREDLNPLQGPGG